MIDGSMIGKKVVFDKARLDLYAPGWDTAVPISHGIWTVVDCHICRGASGGNSYDIECPAFNYTLENVDASFLIEHVEPAEAMPKTMSGSDIMDLTRKMFR